MDDDSIVMRFGLEGKVDEKQIKQEIDKAQKVADAGEVKIPTKTKEVDPKNIKQEVESVQKVADKTPVEIPVKLTQKEIKEELNKLIKQKGKSQKEVRAKLDDIMKDMDFSDTIKESIKTLFIKYRSMANSSKGFSSASQSSKDEFIKLAEKFSKSTGSKKASPIVKVMSDLTASQAQKYRNEKRSPEQLKQDKQKIIDDVNKERAKQDTARQNIQKAYTKKQKATEFVEGKVEDGQTKPGMKQVYEDIIASTEQYKKFTMEHTDNGQNKKAVSFWGDPREFDKFISVFQGYVDKGVADYNNRDEIVPEAKKEYEDVTKNLEALEAESVKRLEEINKLLGPIEKISIDPSKLTPKHYLDLFKEPLPPKKFKLKQRTLTDDVADAAINRDFLKKLARGSSRGKANEVGSDTNLGLRQPVMDGPYVDKNRIIRTAIGGPYADTSSYVRAAIETQKASYKLAKETLEKFIVELNKLQEVIDQRNAEVNAKAEAEGRMGIAGKGRNKNEITEQEKNIHLAQISTELSGKEEKKISKGDPTADVKVFEETLKASFGFLTESLGPSIWKPLEQNINRIMANFAGGTFKITDDPIKGEGKNYAELAKLLSEYFKDINEFFKQNPEMEQLAEASRQLKAAANVSEDAFNQTLKDFSNFLRKFGYNPGRTPTSVRGTSTQNRKESPATGNTMFARNVAETNKNLEKNTLFTKMGNVVQEENVETNKLNANTGTDSEAGKDEVVEATKDVGTTIENVFSSGNDGNGGNNFGGGDLGDTGPSILEQIRDILISINSYTTAIFDLLPKLKLTIKREKRSKKKDESIPEPDSSLYPVVVGELKDRTEEAFQAIRDAGKTIFQDNTDPAKLRQQQAISEVERAREEAIEKNKQAKYSSVGLSQDISTTTKSLGDIIKKAFGIATATTEVDRIKNLNQSQREKELAELTKTYGIADRDRNVTSTGDKGRAFRMKSVYGYRQKDANPFKDLKLTPGLEVDTKGITDALQTMIEKNMFSAQTGVSGIKDIIKLSFGGIGMPSLEKSRAQVDAANEILGIIRQAVLELLQAIQASETTLRGFEASGDAKFDDKGQMVSGSNEAWTAFGQLEEQKSVLNGLIAELTKMDQLSAETGGNMTEFFKVLGFVSPELRKCNTIIGNINSGLNKNGKALKFQSRFQETLNYSFQLLTRHIGQMIKGWIMMLNPINLIKKSFSDFASYDTKWQRTMNVIKYNLRRIVKPMMEWIAQQLVNIIGLGNALVKGLGKAFGQNWDLFDKGAAQAEKDLEDLEAQAGNVTLGFDELHDVGSDNSGANDLSGDIYTPQWTSLYDTIENFGKKIGDVLAGIRKLTEGWNFWTWLAVIGGAIAGFKILKWLIGLFSKKNPLESVAKGFSFLEKAVGWALLIWAFTEFTKALTDFVECMKTATWPDIAKSLIMLGGAFVILALACKKLMKYTEDFGTSTGQLFGLAALVGVFDLFVEALIPFIECIHDLIKDEGGWGSIGVLAEVIGMLIASFATMIGAVVGLEKLQELVEIDWQSLLGLAAVVGVLDLFVSALVPFIECIASIPEGEKIETIVGTFGALITAFLALAGGVATLSRAFKTMDWKAIGQFAVITVIFDLFMATLVPFVNAIKDVPFETLAGGAILIAGAFISLGVAVGIMGKFFQGLSLGAFIELIALIAVMAGVIWVLGEFVKSLQGLTSEQLLSGLALLAGAIILISASIGILAAVFTGLVTTGIGAIAIVLLGAILGVIALIITALADFVRALGEAGEGIKLICEGIAQVIQSIGDVIIGIVTAIATGIATIITSIAEGIKTVLQPIMDFMDSVIGKVTELATTIVKEIGETIRTVIETVGGVVLGIVDKIVNAIPNLLKAIIDFCYNIGPAIENSVDAICRSVTKLVNFVVSAVEYMANLIIGAINKISIQVPDWVPGIGGQRWGFNLEKIDIPRFVPKYEQGTNYVPNDGLAYLHQGEAVIPKKYNTPYQQGLSVEERAYMDKMIATMNRLDGTIAQGINVKGEFRQRGNDLVATVEKNKSRQSNTVLNNKVYAR